MDEYTQGRAAARAHQAHMVPEDCVTPAWQQELAEERDEMRKLAAQGNEEAGRQARYLDGYISAKISPPDLSREGARTMQLPEYNQQDAHLSARKQLARFHSELWGATMRAYALPMAPSSGNEQTQQIETLVWLLIDILRRKGIMKTDDTTTKEGD